MVRSTLYLFIIVLVLFLVGSYFARSSIENFKDSVYAILPKDNHSVRVGKLLYYNDPLFIQYGSKYLLFKTGSAVGEIDNALSIINFIKPKVNKKALAPIAYHEAIYLKTYPDTEFNKIFDREFKIVPYVRPENNQQPYLEIDDYVCFISKDNDYLVVKEGTNELQLLNSRTVPNNGIFRVANSPQCYINNKLFGTDIRDAKMSTMKMIVEKAKNYLEEEKNKLMNENSELNTMKENQRKIQDEIKRLEEGEKSSVLETSNLKEQYEAELKKMKDDIENKKLQLQQELDKKKQDLENSIDEKYIKEMRELISKGCKK